MKYEIEIQDETYVVDVSKSENGYTVRIGDGAQMNVQKVAHSDTVLQLLHNNWFYQIQHHYQLLKSLFMNCHQVFKNL